MPASGVALGRPRDPTLDVAILAAAGRLFGERGYGGMSLEAVATAAQTSVPAVRRRYSDRAQLAVAVIGSLRVQELPEEAPTPRDHALAILGNLQNNLRSLPAMAILGSLLAEEARHPELLQLFKTRLVEPRRAMLRQALAAGPFSPSADLDALVSMLIGSFYGRYITVAGIPEDWPQRILSTIWPPELDAVA